MLIDEVSLNKRIKFTPVETCKLAFLLRYLSVTNRKYCRSVPFLLSIFFVLGLHHSFAVQHKNLVFTY